MKLLRLMFFIASLAWGWTNFGAAPLTKLVFQLDWHFNTQFAGLLLAQELGWYREAGLDVTFLPVDQNQTVVERVVAGTNWIGCSESGVLVNARSKGAPIKAIGTMFQASPMALVSLQSKGYTNLSRLVGKTLGIHPDGQKALEFLLTHDGFRREQFKVIEKDHNLKPLLDGTCDAVQGYLIDEIVELETLKQPINVIPYYEHGYTAYSQVYFTSDSTLKTHRDVIQKFLDVSRSGWQAALVQPEMAANLVIEKYAPDLDREYQRRSLEKIARLATFESGFGRIGAMDPSTWSRMLSSLLDLKVISRPVSLAEMTDFSLINTMITWPPISSIRTDFHQPGGTYPDLVSPPRWAQSSFPRLLDLVVAVNPDGHPAAVMMVKPSPTTDMDKHWTEQVVSRWRWPAGSWRQFRIDPSVVVSQ
jgi:ABC-type nitrate/sulfonate/bicarbonate transport system substrate-binding protein